MRPVLRQWPLLLGALALCACASSRGPDSNQGAPRHPVATQEGATCQSCHQERHATLVSAWSEGPHGTRQVPCITCHGATDASFVQKPEARRCDGCHAAQVQSVTSADGVPGSCFGCHDAHALTVDEGMPNPHEDAAPARAQR